MADTPPSRHPAEQRPADQRPPDQRPADRRPSDQSAAGRRTAGQRPGDRHRQADARGAAEPLWRHILGDQLRALRHARGRTLADTAARAGVSPQYLSEMERGLKEPSSEMIAAVTGALDVSLADLTTAITEHLRGTAGTAEELRGTAGTAEELRGTGDTAQLRAVGGAAGVPAGPTCRLAYALAA
jgi:transcriptional regulator with XRE-family HTH domain